MRMIKHVLAGALALGLALLPVAASATNFTVLDSTGATKTMCSVTVTGVEIPCKASVDHLGNLIDPAQDSSVVALGAILGAVTASPTANTVGDRLKTLNTTLTTINTTLGTPASAANQSTGNTSLASILTGIGAPADAAWTTGSGSEIALLKAIATAALDTTTPSPVKIDHTTPGTTDAVVAAGDVASGSTDSGKALKTGGLAKTSDPTAVADAQRVDDLHDTLGKKVVIPALRGQKGVQQTAITSSTSETTIVTAAGASVFADLYGLTIANSSATDACVTLKDATAGTTRGVFCVKAGMTGGFTVDAGSAIPQAAANNNWTATSSASVASLQITALFIKTKA